MLGTIGSTLVDRERMPKGVSEATRSIAMAPYYYDYYGRWVERH
jgi:hypothetical protein